MNLVADPQSAPAGEDALFADQAEREWVYPCDQKKR
jgi:hypothetical protein